MSIFKITNFLPATAICILLAVGIAPGAVAMPVDRNVSKLEGQGACSECLMANEFAIPKQVRAVFSISRVSLARAVAILESMHQEKEKGILSLLSE